MLTSCSSPLQRPLQPAHFSFHSIQYRVHFPFVVMARAAQGWQRDLHRFADCSGFPCTEVFYKYPLLLWCSINNHLGEQWEHATALVIRYQPGKAPWGHGTFPEKHLFGEAQHLHIGLHGALEDTGLWWGLLATRCPTASAASWWLPSCPYSNLTQCEGCTRVRPGESGPALPPPYGWVRRAGRVGTRAHSGFSSLQTLSGLQDLKTLMFYCMFLFLEYWGYSSSPHSLFSRFWLHFSSLNEE